GVGMPKDFARAARHLAVAARLGDAGSTFVLGQLHLKGLGVARDVEHGRALIEAAARSGHYQAMLTLAALLTGGEDVPRDEREAYKWITIVLNRAPQGDVFYTASGVETQLRARLSSRQIEAAQAEASRFVAVPL